MTQTDKAYYVNLYSQLRMLLSQSSGCIDIPKVYHDISMLCARLLGQLMPGAQSAGAPAALEHSTVRIHRSWAMPNQWAFKMPCVAELLADYQVNGGWADPFARNDSPAEWKNDMDEWRPTVPYVDGLKFLKQFETESLNGVLFDHSYSVEQCLRCYTPRQKRVAGRTEYWARCKDEIARIVKPKGTVISFGWDSSGLGLIRGFEATEILLICHGAYHHDTIVTIESKRGYEWSA